MNEIIKLMNAFVTANVQFSVTFTVTKETDLRAIRKHLHSMETLKQVSIEQNGDHFKISVIGGYV